MEDGKEILGSHLTSKTVLITGAVGKVGRTIAAMAVALLPKKLLLVDIADEGLQELVDSLRSKAQQTEVLGILANVCNERRMERVFKEHQPDIVFHTALYNNVEQMEESQALAKENNVHGTQIVAELAVKNGADSFVTMPLEGMDESSVAGRCESLRKEYLQSLANAIADGKVEGHTRVVYADGVSL